MSHICKHCNSITAFTTVGNMIHIAHICFMSCRAKLLCYYLHYLPYQGWLRASTACKGLSEWLPYNQKT